MKLFKEWNQLLDVDPEDRDWEAIDDIEINYAAKWSEEIQELGQKYPEVLVALYDLLKLDDFPSFWRLAYHYKEVKAVLTLISACCEDNVHDEDANLRVIKWALETYVNEWQAKIDSMYTAPRTRLLAMKSLANYLTIRLQNIVGKRKNVACLLAYAQLYDFPEEDKIWQEVSAYPTEWCDVGDAVTDWTGRVPVKCREEDFVMLGSACLAII